MTLKLREKVKRITLHACLTSSPRSLLCLFPAVVVCKSCHFRCIIPVMFYAIMKGLGTSEHYSLCILFNMLTTTCFGHSGPSSGHKHIYNEENFTHTFNMDKINDNEISFKAQNMHHY
jgi:hypothetical protein